MSLTILVTKNGVTESIKNVEIITIFKNDSADHPKPFLEVDGDGVIRFPKTCYEKAHDYGRRSSD